MPLLVDDWKDVLKHSWVLKAGYFIGAAAGVVMDYEGITIGLLGFLPEGGPQLAGYMAVGVICVSSLLIPARLLKQEKISGKNDSKTECRCS